MSARLIVLAAGGTGGHMFPAEALARELLAARLSAWRSSPTGAAEAFGDRLPGVDDPPHPRRPARRRPVCKVACGSPRLALGIVEARRLLRRLAPGGGGRLRRLSLGADDAGRARSSACRP